MCVIICGLSASLPSRSEFESACRYNSDGYGFALLTKSGQIITEKGMNSSSVLDAFEGVVQRHGVEVEAWVFHARITTHGATCVENCHPFPVNGDQSTYIAHNGILPVRMPKGFTGSDSAYFAEVLFPAWGGVEALNLPETWAMLEDWICTSKVAILSANPLAPLPLVILNEELGVWEGEHWYSNTYHRTITARAYGWESYNWAGAGGVVGRDVYGLGKADEDYDACPYCSAVVDWSEEMCSFCWSCFGCGFDVEACRCVVVETDELVEF